ncbi:peptidoglycan-binding domain-containing protein [Parasedimentitalea psychrophila]|uniref:Peptidoglycan-binding domain-containing protein n=1 Tax=Parasedimentitalea psychrophila TaxID=2997337 RepID=A0A9Y2KWB2_9RHOB|nr:peptidoglycan-binding domain-containing protein [Parasedimentitalea psychrophila]WIY24335.1 peptidoglycan-binding domain-containing protein [Parasedimentitalea psychrophila]
MKSIFIQALFSLFLGGVAAAQGTCIHHIESFSDRTYTVEQWVNKKVIKPSSRGRFDRVFNEGSYRIPILSAMELFLLSGCNDDEFLKSLPSAVAEEFLKFDIPDDVMFSIAAPGRANTDIMYLTLSLHLLGYPKPLERQLEKFREIRDGGDPRGATALAILGGVGDLQMDSLKTTLDEILTSFVTSDGKLSTETNYSKISLHTTYGFPKKYEVRTDEYGYVAAELVDPDLLEISDALAATADANLSAAMELGYGPAYMYKFGDAPNIVNVCGLMAPDIGSNRGRIDVRAEFTGFPNPRKALLDMGKFVEVSAAPNWNADKSPGFRRYTQYFALIVANIASDCAYALHGDHGSYGVVDNEFAEKMILLGASALRNFSIDGRIAMGTAWVIEKNSNEDDKHYAAARFFLMAAPFLADLGEDIGGGDNSFYSKWVPRFSPQTIIEVQKILSEYGFYTSGIDGVPGPAFRRAIKAARGKCRLPNEFPNLCLPKIGSDVRRASWARPYFF